MIIKKVTKNLIKFFGYELVKPNLRNDHLLRRMKLLRHYKIDVIFDVGANIGQYGKIVRQAGYNGNIISFEPVKKVYQKLLTEIDSDEKWSAHNYALGNSDEKGMINIAGNLDSSSLLEMLPSHEQHRPESKYVGKEEICVKKLDSIFNNIFKQGDNAYLKIDAQGYEFQILEGAIESLNKILGIQLELSLEPLYRGEKMMLEMINYLKNKDFKLMSIEPGSVDYNSGQMFQVDGIFFRSIA